MKKKIISLCLCIAVLLSVIPAYASESFESFDDVSYNHWAHDDIYYLQDLGAISGMGNGKFNPNGDVTREQFLKMVISAFGIPASKTDIAFSDVKSGAWYEEYIKTGIAYGIVNGKNESTFGIGEKITRQDACVMIMRAASITKNANNAVTFADSEQISAYAKDAVDILTSNSVVNGFNDNTFRPKDLCTRAQAAKIIKGALDLELKTMDGAKKILFLGDSLTNAAEYMIYIDAFLKTRFPNVKVDILFGGIDGELIANMLTRYKEDVQDKKPDEVYILFGANDVNRGLYPDATEERKQKAIDDSASNLGTLINQLKADGIRNITVLTPPTLDEREYAGASANQRVGVSEGIKKLAEKYTEVAKAQRVRVIDLNTPTRAILEKHKDSGEVEIIKTDRIHPNRVGHFIMASEIIQNVYGSYGLVASVNIDADAVSYRSDNASVTELKAEDGKISYNYTANALPMGIDSHNITEAVSGNGYSDAEEAYPEFVDFTEKMNREIIKVTGLSEGTYEIAFDGNIVTTATAEELSKGINIATLAENPGQIRAKAIIDAYMQNYWTQTKVRRCEVLTRKVKQAGMYGATHEELTAWVKSTYPGSAGWESYLTLYQDADKYNAEWNFLDRYAYKTAQPVTYNVTITPAE